MGVGAKELRPSGSFWVRFALGSVLGALWPVRLVPTSAAFPSPLPARPCDYTTMACPPFERRPRLTFRRVLPCFQPGLSRPELGIPPSPWPRRIPAATRSSRVMPNEGGLIGPVTPAARSFCTTAWWSSFGSGASRVAVRV